MPNAKKNSALRTPSRRTPSVPQEKLVSDARAGLTPSQLVERRLISLLRSTNLPASQLQVSRARRALS